MLTFYSGDFSDVHFYICNKNNTFLSITFSITFSQYCSRERDFSLDFRLKYLLNRRVLTRTERPWAKVVGDGLSAARFLGLLHQDVVHHFDGWCEVVWGQVKGSRLLTHLLLHRSQGKMDTWEHPKHAPAYRSKDQHVCRDCPYVCEWNEMIISLTHLFAYKVRRNKLFSNPARISRTLVAYHVVCLIKNDHCPL